MKFTQRLTIGYIQTKFKILAALSKKEAARQAFELFCTPYMKSKMKHPAIFQKASALQFTLNGLKINGYQWNPGGSKKALLLHGFGSAANNFHHFVNPLIAKGYEVLAFDGPAHGTSEGKTVNAVIYSDMIVQVLDRYGPVDSFIAHSFGGIALCLALEKVKLPNMPKIVFIAPATETSTAVEHAFNMLKLTDEKVKKQFHDIIFDLSGRPTEWFSMKRSLKNFKARILWIHDEDDDITPLRDALKVKEENHAHIQFIVTKGLGHRKIYSDTAIKNKVIDFL